MEISIIDYFKKLEIHPKWYEFGMFDFASLLKQIEKLDDSGDKNTEHYRWRLFIDYLDKNKFFDPEKVIQLYDLIQYDPDPVLRSSITFQIIMRPGATRELLLLALSYDNRSVVKKATELINSR